MERLEVRTLLAGFTFSGETSWTFLDAATHAVVGNVSPQYHYEIGGEHLEWDEQRQHAGDFNIVSIFGSKFDYDFDKDSGPYRDIARLVFANGLTPSEGELKGGQIEILAHAVVRLSIAGAPPVDFRLKVIIHENQGYDDESVNHVPQDPSKGDMDHVEIKLDDGQPATFRANGHGYSIKWISGGWFNDGDGETVPVTADIEPIPDPPVDIRLANPRLVGAGTTAEFRLDAATKGDPGPFRVALYRSADDRFDPSDIPQATSGSNPLAVGLGPDATRPLTFTLRSPIAADPKRPFLLAIAVPTRPIAETSTANNVVSLRLPSPGLVFNKAEAPSIPIAAGVYKLVKLGKFGISLPAREGKVDRFDLELYRGQAEGWVRVATATGPALNYIPRIAGFFQARAIVTIAGVRYTTEVNARNDPWIEVQFPEAAEILGAPNIRDLMDQAWAQTKEFTRSSAGHLRREMGFFINLDTRTGLYHVSEFFYGQPVGRWGNPALTFPLGSENRSHDTLRPGGYVDYEVAVFHTHTPSTYLFRFNPAGGRPVGPSDEDVDYLGKNLDLRPPGLGLVYDYSGTHSILLFGRRVGLIDNAHDLNAPAEITPYVSKAGQPLRRPTTWGILY
jgi:hypothetical protein